MTWLTKDVPNAGPDPRLILGHCCSPPPRRRTLPSLVAFPSSLDLAERSYTSPYRPARHQRSSAAKEEMKSHAERIVISKARRRALLVRQRERSDPLYTWRAEQEL